MAKYRKKPVVIDAERFFPDKKPWPLGVFESGKYCTTRKNGSWCALHKLNHLIPIFRVMTLEGSLVVTSGDWIITGVKGKFYPCKPDIFEMTYEPVPPVHYVDRI
ncbi:hypothetical protein LCGC14_2111770 [marine sediment metagenome]|uniref:Uncharacterized protein n=1 Tax=marine sediment metagenome TaxID=412755 RepID=A0A0F9GK35_9ZZZZ